MNLPNGTHRDPYKILAPRGAGGMGEAYRARDMFLGRDVAIKVLPPYLSSDASRSRNLELEARAAGTLHCEKRSNLGPCPDSTERIRAIRNVGYVYVVTDASR
jgi:serine/threonine protein kinase